MKRVVLRLQWWGRAEGVHSSSHSNRFSFSACEFVKADFIRVTHLDHWSPTEIHEHRCTDFSVKFKIQCNFLWVGMCTFSLCMCLGFWMTGTDCDSWCVSALYSSHKIYFSFTLSYKNLSTAEVQLPHLLTLLLLLFLCFLVQRQFLVHDKGHRFAKWGGKRGQMVSRIKRSVASISSWASLCESGYFTPSLCFL